MLMKFDEINDFLRQVGRKKEKMKAVEEQSY
jgi:hypothetical protein